jgi:hypothetical protein
MAIKKVSELDEATTLANDDLVFISQDDGLGGYVSKYSKANTIKNYVQGNSYKEIKIKFKQTGTSNPVISELIDDLNVTLTATRTGVGVYEITGWGGNISGDYELYVNTNMITGSGQFVTKVTSSSVIEIKTYNAGSLTDGVADIDGLTITLKVY